MHAVTTARLEAPSFDLHGGHSLLAGVTGSHHLGLRFRFLSGSAPCWPFVSKSCVAAGGVCDSVDGSCPVAAVGDVSDSWDERLELAAAQLNG